ncbi:uncharacterized protein TNCV_1835221 [Trichonephila clavipes]|nr:uncharacterized protein TNCV_1835221 [Trichonephila clavipes]
MNLKTSLIFLSEWFRYNTCWTSVDIAPLSYLEIWVGGLIESRITRQSIFTPSFLTQLWRAPSFGKTVIVFTSHLDLTWDTGVDLKFFRVGRSPSRQVWEAYQPQNTEAYPLDPTHCTRLADVYVTWLTWLNDWEMHRDENLPWRVVCPQPWKRALETHVERLHQNALALGMPSDGKPVPIELSIATIPSDGSDHGESCRAQLHTPRNAIHEHERLRLVHAPLPKPVEYLPFCVRGKLSQMGRGSLMVVKRTEQQNFFLELVAMSLETLPEFNAIYDGTFPNSLHEDVSYCTILPICQIPAAV